MSLPRFCRIIRTSLLALLSFSLLAIAHAQGAKKTSPATPIADADADHVEERSEWFLRGRVVPGKSSAELRHHAYQAKMQARAARLARARAVPANAQLPPSSGTWTPLGPVPLASDATGDGFQDYRQVSGRATAVAIDPADATGNTVYIGGAQGGVWKSTNAATSTANNVTWAAATDDQATLSIGSIAIQPGNSDPTKSVILVGTGEADNSGDSYFGLGILRSTDGGNTWTLIPTANGGLSFSGLGGTRMAFSTASGQTNTVVAAMAAASEGVTDGALTSNTYRGLYTSTDAGQSWTFNALFSGASEATSATSVVYNAAAGLFFAAERYHGFYSSPDGLNWTRLATQPGAPGLLSTTACPQNYVNTCPIYRGEITVVPGRNEMYVWFVSLGSTGSPVDQGIWQSKTGGTSWTQISDSGIVNCGDSNGCGIEQGFYNLELLAVPSGSTATDLYAGAINLYKCSISSANATCSSAAFLNLTHVYGCNTVLSALAHVHPDQHALAYTIPSSGTDLMYFANDGGIYRALDGFTGLTTGSCSGTNQFDDLNQNLGSMTQFVSFSQHATDPSTLLGGTQDNGSPATATATTNPSWGNILGGDGGYNAIDPNTRNWFASNPDIPPAGLNIQECSSGVNCNDNLFNVVVSSGDVGGDNGSFYFPYILDPQSTTSLLVGTCRVWRGPRSGGAYTALSLNFETFGTGTCVGNEVNVVRALAAGGPTDANGSKVIYATTDGFGPNGPLSPVGGNVWVTTNAAAVSGTSSTFANVTLNGPGGSSINPKEFPISAVAIDTSDPSGNTAYVTVMGFTGGPGHVWQTTNAGASWTDFTGAGTSALPDSPVNAVVVDAGTNIVYVGTDVGVFQSPASGAAWTEVGPASNPMGGSTGFLPNVAVTALALFNSGSQRLLRASTYGRGIWQFDLIAATDFQIVVSNTPLTAFAGTTPTFNGTVTAVNGYNNTVTLSCTAGSTGPPNPCTPNPAGFIPASTGTPFSVSVGTGTPGNYSFNVQATGSDTNSTTHDDAVTLQVVNFGLTTPSPATVTTNPGTTSPPVSFQVTAQGPFTQNVTLTCIFPPSLSDAVCNFTPGPVVNPTQANPVATTVAVTVPAGTPVNNYTVTLQATTTGAPGPVTTSFTLAVALIPAYVITGSTTLSSAPNGQVMANVNFSSINSYSGQVDASCDATALPGAQCTLSPTNPITIASGAVVPATATINVPTNAMPGVYSIFITSQDLAGDPPVSLVPPIVLTVYQDFTLGSLTPSTPQTIAPGGSVSYNFSVLPIGSSFTNAVTLSCSGAPTISLCTFTPNPVTPGNSSAAVVLKITTTPSSGSIPPQGTGGAALWLALPALALFGTAGRRRKHAKLTRPASLLGLFLLALLLPSCGGGGSNGGGGSHQQGTQPGTYTVIVTGTSGTLGTSGYLSHQAASVTLVVSQ